MRTLLRSRCAEHRLAVGREMERLLAPDAGGASTATTWPSYTSTNEEDAPRKSAVVSPPPAATSVFPCGHGRRISAVRIDDAETRRNLCVERGGTVENRILEIGSESKVRRRTLLEQEKRPPAILAYPTSVPPQAKLAV